MTPVYAGDIAEWILRTLDNPAADGQVFNAVGGQSITQKRYYECVAEALGKPLRLATVPSPVFRRHFASPPQFNWHRPYSCEKAVRLLGYAPQSTPEMMLRETVEGMLANGLVRDCSEEPFDDRLVELLLRHEAELDALLEQKSAPLGANVTEIPITCNKDCGGGCPLVAHVENGRIVKITNNPLAGPYMNGCGARISGRAHVGRP